MASPRSLSSAGAPVGMPGAEPEMFVRCSDPDIICETKHMVMVTLRHRSVLCVLLPWVGWKRLVPTELPHLSARGSETPAGMKPELFPVKRSRIVFAVGAECCTLSHCAAACTSLFCSAKTR